MPRSRRISLLLSLALASVLLAGCGGRAGESSPSRLVPPAAFATAVAEPPTVTINVHVPDAGSIAGTDLWIPFDRIDAQRSELPPRSTRLAVYCRSGRMSAIAVRTLAKLGFRDIVELRGGMEAWRASGRRLLPPGSR